MSLEGLELHARYACWCRGIERIDKILSALVRKEKVNLEDVIQTIKESSPYMWYRFVAWKSPDIKDPFDKKVIEAYWEGNELLKKESKRSFETFLAEEEIPELKWNTFLRFIPGNVFYPFHNFLILKNFYPGLENVKEIDNCKVSVGRITDVGEAVLKVSYSALTYDKKSKNLNLKAGYEEILKRGFVENVHEGDIISFHRGPTRRRLNEQKNISIYQATKNAIKLFNEQQSSE